jgi:hypothetical protein
VELLALLATVSDPEAAPLAVGLKVTLTVQDAPAAMELPQVLVSANGAAVEIEETAAATEPVLVTVTDCAALVEPTASLPKATDVGDAFSVAVPVELPEPGKISNSETCAALHPVLPVNDSWRYWSLTPDGRLKLTVFPVAWFKV